MKHLKTFEGYEDGLNDELQAEDLANSTIDSASIENGSLILKTDKCECTISCAGGNNVELDPEIYSEDVSSLSGLVITDIKVDEYDVSFIFDNGEMLTVYDDTGGEGIEVSCQC